MLLTKEQILAADDLKTDTVSVPEWGGDVRVREATSAERLAYEQSLYKSRVVGKNVEVDENYNNAQARFVVLCVIDEKGQRIFTDKDAEALGKKSATAVGRCYKVIRKLSGMDIAASEELEKNSESAPKDSSPSS